MNRIYKKFDYVLALSSSLLASLIICLLMPLSMYDSNPSEFPMTAYSEVLFYSALLTVAVAAVVFLLLMIVRRFIEKCYLPCVGLLMGVSIALYAQGNLIGADYGALDGHVIQWDAMRAVAVANTLSWIACVLLPVAVAIFFRRIAQRYFVHVTLIFLAYVALLSSMLVFANASAFSRKKLIGFTYDKFMELSSERNLVIIILDSFDRAVFDRLIKDAPTWRDRFSGFTYYHNTVGAYGYTILALPQIVSGYACPPTKDMTMWQYQRKAYREAPFLRKAKDLGFAVDAYFSESEYPLPDEFDDFGYFGNALKNAPDLFSADNVKHYVSLYFCSVFRYLPHVAKRWWCDRQDQFKEYFYIDMHCTKIESELSRRLKAESFTLVPEKKVKIYHCASIHVPAFNLEKAKESLEMVCCFVDKVRTTDMCGITDFFIMADHGSINRCRPLFMCSNGTSEFQISETSFSYRHLYEAFSGSLNGDAIRLVEALPDEMVPLVDDSNRATSVLVDAKYFAGIGTTFSGNGLELLATSAEMDVSVIDGRAKMTWNGKAAKIGIPVDDEVRNGNLIVTMTFDRVIPDGMSFAFQYSDNEPYDMPCEMFPHGKDATDVLVKFPNSSTNPDRRFVKVCLSEWKGKGPPPSLVRVKVVVDKLSN